MKLFSFAVIFSLVISALVSLHYPSISKRAAPEPLHDALKDLEDLRDIKKIVKDMQPKASVAETLDPSLKKATQKLGQFLKPRMKAVIKAYDEFGGAMTPEVFAEFERTMGPRLSRRVPAEQATQAFGFPDGGVSLFKSLGGSPLASFMSLSSSYPIFYAPTLIDLKTGEVYQGAFWKEGSGVSQNDFPLFGPLLPPENARITGTINEEQRQSIYNILWSELSR